MDQNPQRRYDIDWLRIFATLAVFFFHNARFFDTMDWHIKNPEPSEAMFIFAALTHVRGGIFLFIIPIFLVELLIKPPPGGNSTSNFFYYLLFFIIGYLIPADGRFTESLKKITGFSLVSGIAAFSLIGVVLAVFGYDPWDKSFSPMFLVVSILVSINTWCWIAYIMGMAFKHFNKNNKALAYGSQAVLPFYILHQTIILFVGWYIIPLDMFFLLKYLIISTGSFFLIMLIYEVCIKRFNMVRFLFGMRLL